MTDVHDVVTHLETLKEEIRTGRVKSASASYAVRRMDWLEEAVALLQAQEPRVMTWQDVIGAAIECKPLFIEVKDSEDKERGDDRWAMVTQYKDGITYGMIRAMSTYITSEILFVEWYGITWRCWTSRPDEKRRAEMPWE